MYVLNSTSVLSVCSGLQGEVKAHLSLGEPQFGRQVRALRQGQVLGLLEALVQGLQLQTGVDGPRLPDFLPFAIQTNISVLNHRGLLAIFVV